MEQPRIDIRNVRPLRPLRVLVAARDARFNRVAGFLLARRGFDVETLRRPIVLNGWGMSNASSIGVRKFRRTRR